MPICNTRAQGAGRVTCVGKAFRCQKAVYVGRARPHDVEISLARGTWFDKSKLPMELVLSLTYMMAHGESYEHIIREARTLDVDDPQHLSSETVADWYMYFREAVLESILDRFRTRGPIGGPGATVEIDEAKIGHRKYNRGRVVDGHWILGMIDRQTGEVRVEILPNNDRSAQAMLPLIQQHVLPGTTIMTDEWRAYHGLPAAGFGHLTVNHSLHFVDPQTGAHTQNIESTWRHMKRKICRGGVRNADQQLDLHLAEFLWRRELDRSGASPFIDLIGLIAQLYSGN